ncbi:BREX-1 system adenine-specific DNA-methyltransferase PglX [Companilactobacillus muriivasis]|uniref:BREX-1 system adenine-specific DNA-methyltransferase PglX n=1 Tax=Companilactobacillus muriivasis TaxID=3081444 RepID=UPI0030C6F32F
MDKTAIKKFAIDSREKLISEIKLKAETLGITADGVREKLDISTTEVEYYIDDTHPVTGLDIGKRQQLVKELNRRAKKNDFKTAFKDLVEEVAYTWFNRIIAIRFMEVNDYLPSRTNVLSSTQNRNEPDIMMDPLSIEDYLGGFNDAEKALIEKANDTLDPNDMDELYHMLFIKQANALNRNLPYLFEKTNNYAELLFTPNYHNGVIKHLIDDVNVDDFDVEKGGQVEIIGWLYQYYNTEPKDLAFKKKKYTESDIPAVTQLFTPDWLVKYMVENSLGRYWIDILQAKGDARSSKEIAESYGWKYFMPEAKQSDEAKLEIHSNVDELANVQPEDITFLDPAMGSGHILIYAFSLFMKIYETEGYAKRDAAKTIIEKNLFGLDIDTRAFQLSYFALMMKARQYHRRFLTLDIRPNVFDIPESTNLEVEDFDSVISDEAVKNDLKTILDLFKNGNEYGSLILFKKRLNWNLLFEITHEENEHRQLSLESIDLMNKQKELYNIISVAKILDTKFSIGVTNPPYMGSGKMDLILSKYVKKIFPNSKSDLFATFMERMGELTKNNGYYAMVTQHAWMFLSSFESLRNHLKQKTLINMAHLGTRAFEEIGGEVVQSTVFVYKNQEVPNYVGTYERLVDFNSQQKKQAAYLNAVNDSSVNYIYRTNQANFSKIPGMPIAYWASDRLFDEFLLDKVETKFASTGRLKTHDNKRYLRYWWEIILPTKKWKLIHNGGIFRKFYGNELELVDYSNNALANYHEHGGDIGKLSSSFGITWNLITSSTPGFRFKEEFLPNSSGAPTIVATSKDINETFSELGFLNSKVSQYILNLLNPTLNTNVSNVLSLPYKFSSKAGAITDDSVLLSKLEWNSYSESLNFKRHPLLLHIADDKQNEVDGKLQNAFGIWKDEAQSRFDQLKSNEEELNKIFIDLYGLNDELTPEVEDKDVSVRLADEERDIKSFLSYFIGVVFGRYSLDTNGLAFAGGDWDSDKYRSFVPNKDNILMLNDEKYFDDSRDIINRLKEFLKVTFGEESLSTNLKYIASIVGKKADNPEDSIRRYFVEDFFKDHKKIYQKRPIYWEFSSGRNNGFKALMYLHRYDENELAMLRTDYLHPLQGRYESRLNQLNSLYEVETIAKEKKNIEKELKHVTKQLDEIRKYDQSIQHLANEKISLDLDDGVVVNYDKLQNGENILSKI